MHYLSNNLQSLMQHHQLNRNDSSSESPDQVVRGSVQHQLITMDTLNAIHMFLETTMAPLPLSVSYPQSNSITYASTAFPESHNAPLDIKTDQWDNLENQFNIGGLVHANYIQQQSSTVFPEDYHSIPPTFEPEQWNNLESQFNIGGLVHTNYIQ
jgi:hypothetical protein